MPYNSFGSNEPGAYHLPLEKEFSRGRGRLSPSLVPFFPFVWDDRSPLSLEDSLESGDAARDRDDIMSDSTFGTEFRASISDLFSDQGTNLLVDKDLPLAHSQSADGTHPLRMTGSERQLAASKRRRGETGSFRCTLCPSVFTAKHNLEGKSSTSQIFVALSLMSVFQTIITLITIAKPTHALIVRLGSVCEVLSLGISRLVKVPDH